MLLKRFSNQVPNFILKTVQNGIEASHFKCVVPHLNAERLQLLKKQFLLRLPDVSANLNSGSLKYFRFRFKQKPSKQKVANIF